MYNFENYLLQPFISTLIALSVFLGITAVGCLLIQNIFRELINKDKQLIINAPLIGSNFFILLLTPLAYFEFLNIIVFKIIGSLIIIFLIFFLLSKYEKFKIFFQNFNIKNISFPQILILVITVLFFLISIAPVTHADSLGYHMLGAINFLIDGELLKDILPTEVKLVGSGELLIALGLAFGTDQLGGLIQFSSIFTIYYCLKNLNRNKIYYLLFLGIITTPTFIMLASSPKPQLMQISSVLLVSLIIFKIYKKVFSSITERKLVFLIILLLTINFLVKFSFIISSSILFIFLITILYKKKQIFFLFYPILFSLILLIFPKFLFMNEYFGTDLLSFFQSSVPVNLSLYEKFNLNLRNISNGERLLPYWIIFPKDFKFLSDAIGPIFLSFLFFKIYERKEFKLIFTIFIFFVVSVLTFGQASSRFIFEGFVVLQLFLLLTNIRSKKHLIFFRSYIYVQSIFGILVLAYLSVNLTPGVLSYNLREKVMINNANGYELMAWVNNNIDNNETIISSHRSLGLINNKSFSTIYLKNLDPNNADYKNYINFLDKNNVKKILVHENLEIGKFKYCLGKKINTISDINIFIGRNPFNKNFKGTASIYKIKTNKISECLNE